jgi:hypothetical protein
VSFGARATRRPATSTPPVVVTTGTASAHVRDLAALAGTFAGLAQRRAGTRSAMLKLALLPLRRCLAQTALVRIAFVPAVLLTLIDRHGRREAAICGRATWPLPQLHRGVRPDGYLFAVSDFVEPVGPGFWDRGGSA